MSVASPDRRSAFDSDTATLHARQFADAELHQKQQQEGIEHTDGHAPDERNVEQQLQADGHAEREAAKAKK